MTIQFHIERGRSCPKVVCDICEEIIADAKDGLVKWLPHPTQPISELVVVCHKGKCDGNDHWPWQELSQFLVYLTRNLNMDFKQAERRTKVFD